MSSEEQERAQPGDEGTSSARRRRRRRRRNRRSQPEGGSNERSSHEQGGSGSGRRGGRFRNREEQTPAVALPHTGRVPRHRLAQYGNNNRVNSAGARRRRLSRIEMDHLADYLGRMPDQLVSRLYSGMGGQPGRVASNERMIQLAVRAIAQGNRLETLVRGLHQRDRQALAILVQCGGLAHHEEFRQELILSLGGHEREWTKVMNTLGEKGMVVASEEREGHFFYLIPEPFIDQLITHLAEDLSLPSFDHEDVKVVDARAFSPPFDFSLVSLATYIDQRPPRLTQRHEIFKVHKDEMDEFFAQLWAPDSELFSFHIEYLMTHGMVELRGDRLSVNRAVMEEWLQMEPQDQRDLAFAALEKRFSHAEWALWAIHDVGGAWVPERPLQALYRRWLRGSDWRKRFHSDTWAPPRSANREGYSFAPLVNTGMVEMGVWGQEKFYRLNPRATRLLDPPEDDGFTQFYLTPSFEIMAPAGMAPVLFFRIGELAELTACDRANTYKITEVTIERALEKGWRRDDILEFLRENSQIGLPENVEQTLRGWVGHHGDVEFHELTLLTVHRSQIRRLESQRKLKPFLLHRFAPGMYAVDSSRMAELSTLLAEHAFTPSNRTRRYPDDPQAVDARERLLSMVSEAREDRRDVLALSHTADTQPETLHSIPGTTTGQRSRKRRRDELPPRRSSREVRELCERAILQGEDIEMMYVGRDDTRTLMKVEPERLAINQAGLQVLVARDLAKDKRLTYPVTQIERLATVKRKKKS